MVSLPCLSFRTDRDLRVRKLALNCRLSERRTCIVARGNTQNQKLPRKINKYMNKAAIGAIHDVDLILFVVDSLHFNLNTEEVMEIKWINYDELQYQVSNEPERFSAWLSYYMKKDHSVLKLLRKTLSGG